MPRKPNSLEIYSKLEGDKQPHGLDKQTEQDSQVCEFTREVQSSSDINGEMNLYDEPEVNLGKHWTESSFQLRFAGHEHYTGKMASTDDKRVLLIVLLIVAAAVGIGLGVIIGWFSKGDGNVPWSAALGEADDDVTQMIINELNADSIKEFLREFTDIPHLAGTKADKDNAEYVRSMWEEQGLDSARIIPYNILLSYPDAANPNLATILNTDESVFFQSAPEEVELEQGDGHPDAVTPFNAYSPAGVVTGDLVYVNYARVEDFHQLERDLNISVAGKIVLARYGKIFRGDKEYQASQFGAIGMILYSDPKDYAVEGNSRVYPDTWYLPGSGIQRGTLFRGNGDPLTPAYPSTDVAYREKEENVSLPMLPVQPIGYDDAKHFLQELDGDLVPEGWSGAITGVEYRIGQGLKNGRKVKLEVYNVRERRTTHNVIGIIKGSVEPDRYVVIGNHRDAWVFGAVDPSSGTAVMMELSRVFGKLVKKNKWRPRRSILFCSWGAEEYGLIGSTEWIEEFAKTVGERTLAYLNVDISVQGNYTLRVKATPSLYQTTFDATMRVPDAPFTGHSETIYDTWLQRNKDYDEDIPYISNVGSGSDYATFLNRYGIPAVDLRYTYNDSLSISSYPLYHSMYETFYLVSEIMDPSFEYHLAVSRVWGEIARNLADSLIIPMYCTDYAKKIKKSISVLKDTYSSSMAEHGITFDAIDTAVQNFEAATVEFQDRVNSIDKTDPFAVRKVNDQIMLLERAFIDPLGLPDRPLVRHVIFAPSSKDQYYGEEFPGIVDLMFDIENADPFQWEKVAKHMSVVAYTIQSAATTLMEVDILAK